MPHLRNIIRKLCGSPERAHRRFVRARPGSVLILVVTLLVLMALIGTAWISTTQIDRYSAQQNSYNTQVDLLVEGTKNLVQAAILDDLFEGGTFRPGPAFGAAPDPLPPHLMPQATPGQAPGNYEHFDAPWRDPFLASRHPSRDSNNGPVYWSSVTYPSVGGTVLPLFDRPDRDPANPGNPNVQPVVLNGYKAQFTFHPVSRPFSGKPHWPYLDVWRKNLTGASAPVRVGTVPAADCDGDGIADAGLWRLPVGQINGVTYFAAARIIDGNSALNASVAWSPVPINGEPATGVYDGNYFFPTNINLAGSLMGGDNINNFNFNARFNGVALNATRLQNPVADTAGGPVVRTDFDFTSSYEAMWTQLGRRLGNPGYIGDNTRFTTLPLSESMVLAYKFCLVNPAASPSLVEQYLPNSTYNNSPTSPYNADQAALWHNNNFQMVPGNTAAVPLRSMLTARNGVSSAAPGRLTRRGYPSAANPDDSMPMPGDPPRFDPDVAYQFGDWVQYNGRAFVCVQPIPFAAVNARAEWADYAPGAAVNKPGYRHWQLQPWTNHPGKISVNTGTFGQLWAAYFAVMSETPLTPPFPNNHEQANNTNARMFRSPVRNPQAPQPAPGDPTPPDYLTPYDVMVLRSAIAAVNTIDLRDGDFNVTSRRVVIRNPFTGDVKYDAMVFGTERQPYITEVYASNDPDNPYVAVELYNPFPFPITLANWQFATVLRPGASGTAQQLRLVPIQQTVDNWKVPPGGPEVPVVPAYGYAVFASEAIPPNPPYTGNRPTAEAGDANRPLYVLTQLLDVAYDQELVLLRPRRADGVLTGSNDPLNPFAESIRAGQVTATNTAALVPVDSFDFTGLPAPTGVPQGGGTEWHYVRPSDGNLDPATGPGVPAGNGRAWHFVYPGPYAYSPAGTPRQFGTLAQSPPATTDLSTFGLPEQDPLDPALYASRPLQVNNVDFAGPNKTVAYPAQAAGRPFGYPYGAFPRNGDILQVTYVGSYTIRQTNANGTLANAADVFMEINPVTLDSTQADDADVVDDFDPNNVTIPVEQIGRFCPINMGTGAGAINDYQYDYRVHRYAWATDLFDYLSVHSPQDDYLPDVDPDLEFPGAGLGPTNAPEYTGRPEEAPVPPQPQPVPSGPTVTDPALAGTGLEDDAATEGLVNVNTASWRVLAAVPMHPNTNTNRQIAQAIVYFRDVDGDPRPDVTRPHGPFRSLFDLNLIPQFREALGPTDTTEFDDVHGDLSPFNGGGGAVGDGVLGDFEGKFLMMTRASNLLTTRSDTFTVYIQVQGWRGYGTLNPELVVQRRAAFLADRAAVNATNPSLFITNIPTE